MIEIQIRHLTSRPDQPPEWATLTTLTVDGEHAEVDGDQRLIDFSIPVLSLRTGQSLRFEENREEWARALSHSFRSPDLTVAVVHDDHPMTQDELHAPDLQRQTVELRQVAHGVR